MTFEQMIEKFQCPGCVAGSDTGCGHYKMDQDTNSCEGHVLGTMCFGIGHLALGLPKGFCRPGRNPFESHDFNKMKVRLWAKESPPQWDRCNVPVWAMEEDGYLFVRTYMPRLNWGAVDIIEGGKLSELCPQAIDVGQFIDEID